MKYVTYDFADKAINFMPADPNVKVQGNFVLIEGNLHGYGKHGDAGRKIGFDSSVGWLAHLTRNNQLFVKHFAVDSSRP
jgi:hypothetical protein